MRTSPRQLRSALRAATHWCALALVLLAADCSYFRSAPPLSEPVGLIAVLPIERDDPSPGDSGGRLMAGAENVVTAQIYGVLSSSPQWRYVPDLMVTQALSKLPPDKDLVRRAQALGRAVGADAVLCGTVSRYVERVGSEYGAREPAAVSFKLQLISVATGDTLWSGSFDQTQQALSENLLNWWQFWKGGPRWFNAQEFTHLGVERLLDELAARME